MRIVIVLSMIVSLAFSCQKFTFEDGYDEQFSPEWGICVGAMPSWNIGRFQDIGIPGFHERSTQFIYPQRSTVLSCVSSLTFNIVPGGTVEVNVLMNTPELSDQIHIMIMDELNAVAGMDLVIGSTFPGGWHTMRVPVLGRGPFTGRVSILGMSSASSIILVDSIRYIPPDTQDIYCELYDSQDSTTPSTTEISTETVTESTIQSTTEIITEAATESTTEIMTDSTIETIESTIKSTTQGTTLGNTENSSESTTESTTDSGTESTIPSTTQSITEITAEGTSENATDNYTDSTESITESTTENITENSTESTTDSTTEDTTESDPDDTPECTPGKTIGINIDMTITLKVL